MSHPPIEALRFFAANYLIDLNIMRLVVSTIARSGAKGHFVMLSSDLT
jgi:hypothetical protein